MCSSLGMGAVLLLVLVSSSALVSSSSSTEDIVKEEFAKMKQFTLELFREQNMFTESKFEEKANLIRDSSSYSGPGHGFVKVFSHDTGGGLFSSQEEALNKNPDNPDAELFSILDQLEDYRDHEGILHFKLCYPEITGVGGGHCNEWTQTSNPLYYSTIQGFQAIALAFPHDGNKKPWQGLGRSFAKYSVLDDTPSDDTWWTAIGATAYSASEHIQSDDCIPGPLPHLVTKVELYISGGKNILCPLILELKCDRKT